MKQKHLRRALSGDQRAAGSKRYISLLPLPLLVTRSACLWPSALPFTEAGLLVLCWGAVRALKRKSQCVSDLPSPRLSGAKHTTAEASKRKARVSSRTYKEIFTALGPVEPFHHCGGLHLLPLHAGDAAQLHRGALHGLRLRGNLHAHGEADADWREAGDREGTAGVGEAGTRREDWRAGGREERQRRKIRETNLKIACTGMYIFTCAPQGCTLRADGGRLGGPRMTRSSLQASQDAVRARCSPEPCPQRLIVRVRNRAHIPPSVDHPCAPSFNHHSLKSTPCQA